MNKNVGYQINEKDIEATLNFLKKTENENATREDAIVYLQKHQPLAHMVAHEFVKNEQKK